jgi:hypothetical protein
MLSQYCKWIAVFVNKLYVIMVANCPTVEQPMLPLDISALVQPIRERVRGNRGRRESGEMDEERKGEGKVRWKGKGKER